MFQPSERLENTVPDAVAGRRNHQFEHVIDHVVESKYHETRRDVGVVYQVVIDEGLQNLHRAGPQCVTGHFQGESISDLELAKKNESIRC